MITLLDNTVMSNFAVVKQPILLKIAFCETLATPEQAFHELQVGIRVGKLPDLDWQWLPVWSLQPGEMTSYHQFLLPHDEANSLLCQMISAGYHSPVISLEEIL